MQINRENQLESFHKTQTKHISEHKFSKQYVNIPQTPFNYETQINVRSNVHNSLFFVSSLNVKKCMCLWKKEVFYMLFICIEITKKKKSKRFLVFCLWLKWNRARGLNSCTEFSVFDLCKYFPTYINIYICTLDYNQPTNLTYITEKEHSSEHNK